MSARIAGSTNFFAWYCMECGEYGELRDIEAYALTEATLHNFYRHNDKEDSE